MKNPFGGMGGLGGLGDMAKMMSAARDMQGKVEEFQKSLEAITVTGEAGAGLVRVTATAKGELTGLEIDPSIFVPSEKQVVEDLILAAIKDVQARATERTQSEAQRLAHEMGLPPGMELPV
ncbi:YbaB/EbfC family nucleoid-associated protein [Paracoccus sanguinis]|nr:YbaB/EbfC family nucleoid-associated protein [Paracoccus sanguinis]